MSNLTRSKPKVDTFRGLDHGMQVNQQHMYDLFGGYGGGGGQIKTANDRKAPGK